MRRPTGPILALTALVACSAADSSDSQPDLAATTEGDVLTAQEAVADKVPAAQENPAILRTDGVLVEPSPAEVFAALDKFGDVDWGALATGDPATDYGDKFARALNLGVRAADAFMAIQAEDERTFGRMSTAIFTLGEDLGIGETLLDKRDEIQELARGGSWLDVRRSLDNLRTGIDEEIERLDEPALVVLAGVAGWLEGLRAVSFHLSREYDETTSSLLYQPDVVSYYADQMAGLPPEVLQNPIVTAISSQLAEIRSLIDVGSESPVAPQAVQRLSEISESLVTLIQQG